MPILSAYVTDPLTHSSQTWLTKPPLLYHRVVAKKIRLSDLDVRDDSEALAIWEHDKMVEKNELPAS